MNPIKPPLKDTEDFNGNFEKMDLSLLRKQGEELGFDTRDLLRAGAKLILKIKDRNKIVRILITPRKKNGHKNAN